ncbi:recombinase family protein [Streptomyces sp. AS02]|uniref:recombinase family protein n=1 Tax=Streptomyces sp. AS02 TaxID=2938946 RepID=UPI0020229194|nr:recombinase family protein [Streptomyces sp. AS02]MCL8016462.1 recombinase family protein [Streptomyces sp. AS02]
MAGSSKGYLNPELVRALQQGKTFEEWLDGKVPGVDYGRISADQAVRSSTRALSREKGKGVRHQHEGNEETAAAHGIAIVRFYEDNNITAADPEVIRPAFLEMTKAVLHRKVPEGFPVRAVIATEHERVWRLPEDYIRFRRAVITHEDGIFIERGKVYDLASVGGNILGLVNSGVSEGEVTKTKERIMRDINRRAQDGSTPGGRRRFGYLPQDPRTGRKVNEKLCPKEGPWAIQMKLWGMEGAAWKTIALRLREHGIKGATGKDWCGETVRQYLTNATNYGYRQIHGKLVVDRDGNPVVGKWDTIGTSEEWQFLCSLSKQRGAKTGSRLTNGGGKNPGPPEGRARKYLWSGFLRCGNIPVDAVCNTKIGGTRRPTKKDPDMHEYVCNELGCGGVARNGKEVDAHLEALVVAALEAKYKAVPKKVKKWEGSEILEELKKKKKTLTSKWMEGEIDDDTFYDLLPNLEDKIKGLEQDRAEHALSEAEDNLFSGWDRSRWYGDPKKKIPPMDLTQKRMAIGKIIKAVIIMPLPEGRSRKAPFDPNLLKIIPQR